MFDESYTKIKKTKPLPLASKGNNIEVYMLILFAN